jgi:hypothetical protein
MNRNVTPTELIAAHKGEEITINTGERLCALPSPYPESGAWKYVVSHPEHGVALVRYANEGLDAALWAINATQEEYDAS